MFGVAMFGVAMFGVAMFGVNVIAAVLGAASRSHRVLKRGPAWETGVTQRGAILLVHIAGHAGRNYYPRDPFDSASPHFRGAKITSPPERDSRTLRKLGLADPSTLKARFQRSDHELTRGLLARLGQTADVAHHRIEKRFR